MRAPTLVRPLGRLAALAAPVALVAAPAAGQFVEPGTTVHLDLSGTGGFGWAVSELADIDGDGAMEVIVAAPFVGGVNFQLGDGRALVVSGATGDLLMDLAAPGEDENFSWSIADAGDVNGDGFHDVVVGAPRRGGFAGGISVYSGHPDALGSLLFSRGSVNGNELFGYAVAGLGDVDGDGRSEILVGAAFSDVTDPDNINSNDGRAYVVSGADGSILRTHDAPGGAGSFFGLGTGAVGDLDGDGRSEYVVAATGTGRAFVYDGATGDPILVPLEPSVAPQAFGQFFVGPAGDVNADGVPDIYVGDYAAASNRGRAYVYDGTTGTRIIDVAGNQGGVGFGLGCGRGAGDVDGDGHDDLAVGAYLSGQVAIISGRTSEILRVVTSTTPGGQFGFDAVGVGDVTGDGVPDFLGGAAVGAKAFLIAGRPPCPGDLIEDGEVGFTDLTLLLAEWGPCAGCPADVDGSGAVDFADLLVLVAGWGPCP